MVQRHIADPMLRVVCDDGIKEPSPIPLSIEEERAICTESGFRGLSVRGMTLLQSQVEVVPSAFPDCEPIVVVLGVARTERSTNLKLDGDLANQHVDSGSPAQRYL